MPAAAKPATLAEALFKVQSEIPTLQKQGINPHFGSKYITLDSLTEQVLPILQKHGVLLMQPLSQVFDGDSGSVPAIATRLVLASTGENLEYLTPIVLGKRDPQGLGSAVTYTRRYALMAALSIVADVDDDANSATPPRSQPVPGAATNANDASGDPFASGAGAFG